MNPLAVISLARAGAAVALVIALIFGIHWFNGIRRDAEELPKARAALHQQQQQFDSYRRNTIAETLRITRVAAGYSHEIQTLRDNRSRPVSLRVCPQAPDSGTVARPDATPCLLYTSPSPRD
jgi:hypothetical protein